MKNLKIICICLLFSSTGRSTDHLTGPFDEKPVIIQTFPKDVAKNILHIKGEAKFEIRTDKVHCNVTAVQNSTLYDLNFSVWGTVPEINQVDYADFSFGEGEFNPNWYGHLKNPSKNMDVMHVTAIIRKFDEPTERYFVDLRDVYGTTIPFAKDDNKSLKIFKIGVKTWYPNADSDIFWEDTENNMNLWAKQFNYIGSVVYVASSLDPYNVDKK